MGSAVTIAVGPLQVLLLVLLSVHNVVAVSVQPVWSVCADYPCVCTTNEEELLILRCTVQYIVDLPLKWPAETAELYVNISENDNIQLLSFSGLSNTTLKVLEINQQSTSTKKARSLTTPWSELWALSGLQRLKLSFRCKNINSNLFERLFELQELDMSNMLDITLNQLSEVLHSLADKPLRRLVLRAVLFTWDTILTNSLNLTTFLSPLQLTPLEHLDLSGNAIADMSPGLVKNTPNLKTFVARDNLLSQNTKPSLFFEILMHPMLEEVDISFQGHSQLRESRSVINPLTTGNQDFLAKEVTCKFLQTRYPAWFSGIPCEVFPPLMELTTNEDCWHGVRFPLGKNLRKFDASDAQFYHRAGGITAENNTLCASENNNFRHLDVSRTIVKTIGVSFLRMKGLNKLEYLAANDNEVQFSDVSFLDNFPALQVLMARGNTWAPELNVSSLGHEKLRILDLSECNITAVPSDSFVNFFKLEDVNLSKNRLQFIELNLSRVANLHSLRFLNLSGNLLQTLSPVFRQHLDARATDGHFSVDLSNNPLSCSCSEYDFLVWLRETPVTLENVENYLCSSPNQGRSSVTEINLDQIKDLCYPSYTQTIIISVSVTIVVVAIICVIVAIVNKRWKIRYLLFLFRKSRRRHLNKNPNRKFQYDAFVSYNSVDRPWVYDVLQVELEDKHSFKLCIDDRDFPPNHALVNSIEESIEESRKTILILSPNFIQSNQCQFELLLARQRLLDEGRDVLVMIILRELPAAGVNKVLSSLLQTTTYLTWTQNPAGQKLFWQKLVFTLKDDVFPFEQ